MRAVMVGCGASLHRIPRRQVTATPSSGVRCLPRVSGPSDIAMMKLMPAKGPEGHRDRKSEVPVDGKEGDDRCGEAAKDRALVVAEPSRRGAHLRWESFGHIAGVGRIHAAGPKHPLQAEEHDDHRVVLGEQIERRHEKAADRREDQCPTPAKFMATQPHRNPEQSTGSSAPSPAMPPSPDCSRGPFAYGSGTVTRSNRR